MNVVPLEGNQGMNASQNCAVSAYRRVQVLIVEPGTLSISRKWRNFKQSLELV